MKGKLSLVSLLAVVFAFSGLAFASAGAVYTLNNSSTGNAVLLFARTADGHISPTGMFPTGGKGTGKGLGNQGALAIDAAEHGNSPQSKRDADVFNPANVLISQAF